MGSHSAQAGDMSPDEFNRMSPREQETYLVEKAQEGVTSDSWLIGPIQRLMATGDARAEAERIREQSIRETTSSGDIQYVQGLQSSDANYPGTAHAQLVQFVTNGNNPSTVGETSDEYNALYQDLQTFADEFSEAVNASRSEWEGEAGDAARTFFTTMSTWSEGNAGNAKLASETIYSQSTAAATAKNSMPEEIPFSWGDELTSWATASPLTLSSRVGESFEKQRASQDAHDEAARVMTTFDNDTYAAASKQPEFPEPPKFSLSGESGSGDRNGRIDDRGTGTPTVGGPGGSGGTSAASYAPPGGGGYTTPSGSAPGSTAPSGSGGPVQLPDGTIRYPDGRVRLPNGSIRYPDGTIRRPDGTILRPGGTRAAGLSSGGFDPSGASGTSF
ncbi:MAG: hypothetical protein ACRDSE_24325, partial [Pseudonocardiaceae bacterium]